MKVAITHDILVEFGGAERVLQSLLHIYPGAKIYTAYLDRLVLENFTPPLSPKNIFVIPTRLFGLKPSSHIFQLLMPFLWQSLNLEENDVVISSSSFFMSNIIRVRRPLHIQYIHCPPKNIFGLSSKTPLQKLINYAPLLKRQYVWALRQYPHIVVNSRYTQRVLRRISGVASTIIHPPVYVPASFPQTSQRDYFLIVSRLDKLKNIEMAIRACIKLGVPLKIVGEASDGNYLPQLRQIAGPNIEFLGFKKDTDVRALYRRAIAFIFTPRTEDFGIAPVEAMAYGVPVIAYFGGGAKETIIHKKTGVFYFQYTQEALVRAILMLRSIRFSPSYIHAAAKKFDMIQFERRMSQYTKESYEQYAAQ